MSDEPVFRWAEASDYDPLGGLVYEAIRSGPSPYSEIERAAWAPAPPAGPNWHARLSGQAIILALAGGEAAGFMSLDKDGYIDLAFIRPAARGKGLFGEMLARIVGEAEAKGVERLWTHASLMAAPAFSRHGFTIVQREEVALGTESLTRFEMERHLQRR